MNLCELSQEQQRTVIQMQLQGNAFFEHLVSFAECRKTLDQSSRSGSRATRLGPSKRLALGQTSSARQTRALPQACTKLS